MSYTHFFENYLLCAYNIFVIFNVVILIVILVQPSWHHLYKFFTKNLDSEEN